MCGIAGVYDHQGKPDDRRAEVVQRMTRTLVHRGPDDEGYHFDRWVGLGHRRLSIIDLSSGRQPLSNEDGTVWIVFNGEIYNYRDLKRELEAKGHRFATHTDTETIVHAYEEWGEDCLEHLRGMFAFALWDQRRQRLFAARDRVGKKPLYYAALGDVLLFGSEIKAILAYPGIDRSLDLEAVSDYLSFLYVPSPKTIFAKIRKLPPGHFLLANRAGIHIRRYWDVRFDSDGSPDGPIEERLAEQLHEAVQLRLRSDVPLGAFLSGGLDSSSIVGLMAKQQVSPLITSSIGFPQDDFNELAFARQVARHFDTDHHEHTVTPDAMDVLRSLVWHYDEPFADSSAVPTSYRATLARRNVTVALSGDGGDESFAGYRRYYFDGRENRVRCLVPAALRRPVFGLLGALYPKADYLPRIFRGKAFLSNVARDPWDAYFFTASAIGESDKDRLLSAAVRQSLGGYSSATLFEDLYHAAGTDDPLARIQYIDFKCYLPGDILTKVDRASMANSLEVRCPLLDHRLIEYVASLPSHLKMAGTRTKVVFKNAMRGLLPDHIIDRKKMGFAVPIGAWLRDELSPLVHDYVLDTGKYHDLFDPAVTAKLWREHKSGLRERSTELWVILMFNLWHERFVNNGASAA